MIKPQLPEAYLTNYTHPLGSTKTDSNKNIILSKRVRLGRGCHANDHVAVIGKDLSHMVRSVAVPNVLQCCGSYVVLDQDGTTKRETEEKLKKDGYRILTITPQDAPDTYNPFRYLKKDADIAVMAQSIINALAVTETKDEFWLDAQRALLYAVLLYLYHDGSSKDQNLAAASEMLERANQKTEGKTELDLAFERVKAQDPEAACVVQYEIFKQIPEKTACNVLISLQDVFRKFADRRGEDTLHLETTGEEKTVIFLSLSTKDPASRILTNLFLTQFVEAVYSHAQALKQIPPALPIQMILPDFASIGVLPDFLSKFLTMQHYRISCILLLRSASELKQAYHDDADLLLDTGCMACVYSAAGGKEEKKAGVTVPLGGASISNPEYIANRAGYDRMPSGEKRPVLTADQVRTLAPGQVLCLIGGFDAVVDDEYAPEA